MGRVSGTWVSLELNEALKYGYTIINIYQIWHWEQRSKSLFTNYINMFLKYKQESSGVPSNIEEDKDFTKKDKLINEYISEFQSVESILLEKNKLIKNDGVRNLSKFMLNSFWGKYAQNPDKVEYKILSSHQELMKYIMDGQYEIKKLIFNHKLCQNFYKNTQIQYINSNGNVVIGAFVTAQARLKLFEYLNLSKDRML